VKINERQKAALRTAQIGPLFARGRSYRRDGGYSIGTSTAQALVEAGLLEKGTTRFNTPMVKITDAGLDAIGVRRRFACTSPDEDQAAVCSLHDRIAP
jgi:hypothetical protein